MEMILEDIAQNCDKFDAFLTEGDMEVTLDMMANDGIRPHHFDQTRFKGNAKPTVSERENSR